MEVKLTKHNAEDQIRWGSHADTRKHLVEGNVYEVERKEVHTWHTKLFLKDFPELSFNSVCFEELPDQESKAK